jgi:fibronectin-binding autotransporter adhesin
MRSPSRLHSPVVAFLFAVSLLGAPALLAQTTTWQVTGAGDFQVGTNWDFGTPGSGTNAVVTNGTSGNESIVNLSNGGSVANLTLGAFDTFNVLPGGSLSVSGSSISNAGAFNVTGGSGQNSFLTLGASTTLTGTGVLNLAFNGVTNGAAFIEQSVGGVTLTNQSTIAGTGVIGNGGLALVNGSSGVINANVSGATLTLNQSGGMTNQGLLEATGGGQLSLSALNFSNVGATITAGTGSSVQFSETTVVGGTLNQLGTGTLVNENQTTLDGNTSGALTINGNFLGGPGATTIMGGTIVNNGNIQITGGSGSNSFLALNNNTTFQGTGATITLGFNGVTNGAAFIEQTIGGVTLTNKETIQGQGVIGNGGIAVVNTLGSTIDANVNGATLTLNGSGGFTNNGLLEATSGGTLAIDGISIANSGATLTAATGSSVQLSEATIVGGTVNQLGTGTLVNENQTTFDGNSSGALTINGNLTTGPGTTTIVGGSIVNNGNLQITGGSGSNSFLALNNSTTFQGTGATITLGFNGVTNGAAIIEQTTGGVTLTNKETIQGAGIIGNGGIAVVNTLGSTIDANVSGQTLTLNGSGGFTNNGLLEATSGGTLAIDGISIANSGATITAATGSALQLSEATIVGGTINQLGTGTLVNENQTTFDGSSSGALTINGNLVAGAGTTTIVGGSIVNNGNLQITGGSGTNSFLALDTNTTFQGTGATITLGFNGITNGQAVIEQTTGGVTLTNKETIQGQGIIGNGGLTVINSPGGTIDANVNGGTLTLNGSGGLTNTGGLLEASNGGTLSLSGSTIDNAGGTIKVDGATSGIQFVDGVTIQGGTITSADGGSLGVPGSSITLDGTSQGALTLSTGTLFTAGPGTTTNLTGTIVDNGNMQINGGNGTNTFVALQSSTTLAGTGTLTLGTTGAGVGEAVIEQTTGGVTLTNEDTIQGQGLIGNGGIAVVNSSGGTIDANVSGQTLTLNGSGGVANTGGLLEATGGGILSLSGSTIDNAGGTIAVDGATSSIQLVDGVTIQGGTLTSSNGGSLGVPGSSITLDGASHGALTFSTGTLFTAGTNTTTNLEGTIVNNGNMQVDGGNGTNSLILLGVDTTLSGGGTLSLGTTGVGVGEAIIEQTTGGVTLTNESTIQGQGLIGNGGIALVNSPGGTIDANVSGATLTLNGSGAVTNTGGLLEATHGGTLALSQSVINNLGGTIAVDGATSTVDFHDASTIQGGTLTSSNGGVLRNGGLTAILDGSTHGAITLSAGSTFATATGQSTNLLGSIVNNGTLLVTGGGATDAVLGLNADTTLSGTGVVTLGTTGGPGAGIIQQNQANLTLTNRSTIHGTGAIGNGGLLSFDNASGGIVSADVASAPLSLDALGGLTNAGTLEALNGGDLEIANTVVANAGGLIQVQDSPLVHSFLHLQNGATVTGGELGGTGTIVGNLTNEATVFMGADETHSGVLSETGDYTQGAAGTLFESISAGGNGVLDVTGNVDLDGIVDVDLLDGFTPTNGEEFALIDYSGSLTGAIAGIIGSDATEWTIVNLPGSVDLRFGSRVVNNVAEPSAWVDLAFMGALALGFPLIRRRISAS